MTINTDYFYSAHDYQVNYGSINNPIIVNDNTIYGNKYNDFFNIEGNNVTVNSGLGHDYIRVEGFNSVINAGYGDDIIDLVVIPDNPLYYNYMNKSLFHPIDVYAMDLLNFHYIEYDVTGGAGYDIFKISPSEQILATEQYPYFAEINIKDFDKYEDKIDLRAFGIGYEDIQYMSDKDELYITKIYHVANTKNEVQANFRIDLQGMEWSDLDESNFIEISYDIEA